MNRDNDNASTPDVNDESVFNPHPFTEDEPVTAGQRTEELAPEPDPDTGTGQVYADAEREQADAYATRREQAYEDTTPEDTYADATRDQKYAGTNREEKYAGTNREEGYAGTNREERYAGTNGAGGYAGANRTAAGVPELGPLFDETQASDFQRQWGHIQSGFVEDPQGAVRLAKDLTDSIVSSLARALEERRNALDHSARNGDTEQLRLVLRQYREVLEEVTSL